MKEKTGRKLAMKKITIADLSELERGTIKGGCWDTAFFTNCQADGCYSGNWTFCETQKIDFCPMEPTIIIELQRKA